MPQSASDVAAYAAFVNAIIQTQITDGDGSFETILEKESVERRPTLQRS